MSNKICYILRGLPGCGKSTLADTLANIAKDKWLTWTICCADDYMIEAGVYKWSAEKVAAAHNYCRVEFNKALSDSEVIIVANTSTTKKEYKYYYDLAKEHNYFVQVITVGEFSDEAVERYVISNQHNVPRETILKMRDRFEHKV